MKICIIIPMYNEEALAHRSLETILPYVQKIPCSTTVLVIDDGSKDHTATAVKEYIQQTGSENILHLISHERNQGYGAALRTGMQFAIDHKYDYALFMDSDLTNHPRYLTLFYSKMVEGCDYIKATRYAGDGGMEGVVWRRRAFSWLGNIVGRFLFRVPLSDVTNGFRAVKIDILKKIHLHENGFPIIMEELYQAKPYIKKFGEVPYVLTERKEGQGTTHFSYTFNTIKKYLAYAWRSFLSSI